MKHVQIRLHPIAQMAWRYVLAELQQGDISRQRKRLTTLTQALAEAEREWWRYRQLNDDLVSRWMSKKRVPDRHMAIGPTTKAALAKVASTVGARATMGDAVYIVCATWLHHRAPDVFALFREAEQRHDGG